MAVVDLSDDFAIASLAIDEYNSIRRCIHLLIYPVDGECLQC